MDQALDGGAVLQGSPEAPALAPELLAYLGIDRYLRGVVEAGALRTAFELRLVDLLQERGSVPVDQLVSATGSDPQGLRFLLDLLGAAGVVDQREGAASLQPAFAELLRYRELIETKLEYAAFMLADFNNLFTAMVANPQRFMRHGRVFRLFDYSRCFDATPENLRHTHGWMRLTTALTRHEAPVCLALHDFSAHRRMLDVGGNSGEFALQACRRHAQLRATVADLPVVCELGLEHALAAPERDRIGFVPADLRKATLPGGHDLISFKSMLHDWPAEEAQAFLAKAVAALEPGGTVMIFERGPLDVRSQAPGLSTLPVLMFFRSYRSPGFYVRALQSLGMPEVRCLHLQLDTPWFLVTARKPRR